MITKGRALSKIFNSASHFFLEVLSLEISKVYSEIDRQIGELKKATGLKCPPGCGLCCVSGKIKITPLESLPLVNKLFQRGEGSQLRQLLREQPERPCIFFQPKSPLKGYGFCNFYPWRPATCRLYGFAFKRNKYGLPELIACKYLKNEIRKTVGNSLEKGWKKLPCPSYDSFLIQIASLNPFLGTNPLPINQAFAKALEKYILISQFTD